MSVQFLPNDITQLCCEWLGAIDVEAKEEQDGRKYANVTWNTPMKSSHMMSNFTLKYGLYFDFT